MERRTFVFGGLATLLSSCIRQNAAPIYEPRSVAESPLPFHFPNIDVWSLDGRLHTLSSFYHEKPLLLNTVQYGCDPCKESFPILNELYSKIEVLGLYCGWGEDFATDRNEWIETTRGHTMDFPSVLVANRGDIPLDKYCRENFQGCDDTFPTYFIIDNHGVCTHYQSGGLNFQDRETKLRDEVRKALKK